MKRSNTSTRVRLTLSGDGEAEAYEEPPESPEVMRAEPIEVEAPSCLEFPRADEAEPPMGQGESAANAITTY